MESTLVGGESRLRGTGDEYTCTMSECNHSVAYQWLQFWLLSSEGDSPRSLTPPGHPEGRPSVGVDL